MTYKPKMRIKLLDEEGRVLSDRLIDQYTELLQGPKDEHQGPVSIEVNLIDAWAFERFQEYLLKLKGKLPLDTIRTSSTPTTKKVEPYKEIIQDVKSKGTVEEVIKYLETLNFRFVTSQFIEELESLDKVKVTFAKSWHKKYQFMTRLARIAKDPMNDKYDFNLMFGIKLIGGKKSKILIYKKGEYKGLIKINWENESDTNFKERKQPTIFPSFMSIEDRKKWRVIHRKIELERPIGPTEEKFYNRYKPDIKGL